MKQTKIRQRQVAEELEVSQATVAQMFSRDREIDSIRYVEAIAKLTGFPQVWLMYGDYKMIKEDLDNGLTYLITSKPTKK